MERIFTPFGAPIERTQGCWSCKHWDNQQAARDLWSSQRQSTLRQAQAIAAVHAEGEDHAQVVTIRRMVDTVDRAVAVGVLGICRVQASESDLVHNAYLCDRWEGAVGASVARAGQKPDKLPQELRAEAEAASRHKDHDEE